MNKFVAIVTGLFISFAAFADSNSALDTESLNKQGVNYIVIGDNVTILKTENTAKVVESLTVPNVVVIDYAKSFEERKED